MREFLTDKEIAYLVDKYTNLIHYVIQHEFKINQYSKMDIYSYEDFFSEGKIGLIGAIGYYNMSCGVSEKTFYYTCIRNRINSSIVQNVFREFRKAQAFSISLNGILTDYENIELIDSIKSNDNSIEDVQLKTILDMKVENKALNHQDITIINMLLAGYLMKEVRDNLKISQSVFEKKIGKIKNEIAFIKDNYNDLRSIRPSRNECNTYISLNIKTNDIKKYDSIDNFMKIIKPTSKEALWSKVRNRSLIDKRYILFKNKSSLDEWRNS